MNYTEEEIKKWLEILHNYKVEKERAIGKNVVYHICKGCLKPKSFIQHSGYYICNECGKVHGNILGNYEMKDFDRLHYQKKSIYRRKYYLDKKINYISKLINLTDEEKCELFDKLLILNSNNMSILNKQYYRKRLININFIIKKILEEIGCEKYKNIKIKISPEILETYNNWWKSYKEIIK